MSRFAPEKTCPACLAARHHYWECKNDFGLRSCLECGAIFTSDQADAGEVKELYDHYYDRARFDIPAVVANSLGNLARSFKSVRRTGRWLDIGYGEGGLLTIAREHGWACYGTEISPQALKYGARQGWVVTASPESDARFVAKSFDVVTMVEILEHVPSPDRLLAAAARFLRPGGLLYLTTPNADSLNRKLLGVDWSIFSPPEHLVIWTARGLRRALCRNGLQPLRIRTEGLNPSEVLGRLRSRASRPLPGRNEAGLKLNQAFAGSPFRLKMKAGINRCLSMFRLGDSLKAWAVRPA
jgi:SAM-dependent methyltransferase